MKGRRGTDLAGVLYANLVRRDVSRNGRQDHRHQLLIPPSFNVANPEIRCSSRCKLIGAIFYFIPADMGKVPIIEHDVVRISLAHRANSYGPLRRNVRQAGSGPRHPCVYPTPFPFRQQKTVGFPASPRSNHSQKIELVMESDGFFEVPKSASIRIRIVHVFALCGAELQKTYTFFFL
ncbi:hypothetical protein [Maritimibacter dapengensis]|uniref:Uncharacterized protein n=1 Tax=Maritimibacter dapengensis TaxID=2836868 RepID=A0ABS6T3X8_9RHOB|nr:hypothetical protein [Maritimibacter dapengensis]MBV7379956.1 hypothetical protein [Maritimibacter dapengensis]